MHANRALRALASESPTERYEALHSILMTLRSSSGLGAFESRFDDLITIMREAVVDENWNVAHQSIELLKVLMSLTDGERQTTVANVFGPPLVSALMSVKFVLRKSAVRTLTAFVEAEPEIVMGCLASEIRSGTAECIECILNALESFPLDEIPATALLPLLRALMNLQRSKKDVSITDFFQRVQFDNPEAYRQFCAGLSREDMPLLEEDRHITLLDRLKLILNAVQNGSYREAIDSIQSMTETFANLPLSGVLGEVLGPLPQILEFLHNIIIKEALQLILQDVDPPSQVCISLLRFLCNFVKRVGLDLNRELQNLINLILNLIRIYPGKVFSHAITLLLDVVHHLSTKVSLRMLVSHQFSYRDPEDNGAFKRGWRVDLAVLIILASRAMTSSISALDMTTVFSYLLQFLIPVSPDPNTPVSPEKLLSECSLEVISLFAERHLSISRLRLYLTSLDPAVRAYVLERISGFANNEPPHRFGQITGVGGQEILSYDVYLRHCIRLCPLDPCLDASPIVTDKSPPIKVSRTKKDPFLPQGEILLDPFSRNASRRTSISSAGDVMDYTLEDFDTSTPAVLPRQPSSSRLPWDVADPKPSPPTAVRVVRPPSIPLSPPRPSAVQFEDVDSDEDLTAIETDDFFAGFADFIEPKTKPMPKPLVRPSVCQIASEPSPKTIQTPKSPRQAPPLLSRPAEHQSLPRITPPGSPVQSPVERTMSLTPTQIKPEPKRPSVSRSPFPAKPFAESTVGRRSRQSSIVTTLFDDLPASSASPTAAASSPARIISRYDDAGSMSFVVPSIPHITPPPTKEPSPPASPAKPQHSVISSPHPPPSPRDMSVTEKISLWMDLGEQKDSSTNNPFTDITSSLSAIKSRKLKPRRPTHSAQRRRLLSSASSRASIESTSPPRPTVEPTQPPSLLQHVPEVPHRSQPPTRAPSRVHQLREIEKPIAPKQTDELNPLSIDLPSSISTSLSSLRSLSAGTARRQLHTRAARRQRDRSQSAVTRSVVSEPARPTHQMSAFRDVHQPFLGVGSGISVAGPSEADRQLAAQRRAEERATTQMKNVSKRRASGLPGAHTSSASGFALEMPSQPDTTPTDVPFEHLPYIENPSLDQLERTLNSTQSGWRTTVTAIVDIRSILKHTPDLIRPNSKQIIESLGLQVKSLRSSISKNAIMAVGEAALVLQTLLDSNLTELLPILFKKSAEGSAGFIQEECDTSITRLVENCSPRQVLRSLLPLMTVPSNKTRARVANALVILTKRGTARFSKPELETIFKSLVRFSEDSVPDARASARAGLMYLSDQLDSFMTLIETHVPRHQRAKLLDAISPDNPQTGRLRVGSRSSKRMGVSRIGSRRSQRSVRGIG